MSLVISFRNIILILFYKKFRLTPLVIITLLVSAIKIRLGNEPFSLGRGGDILFFYFPSQMIIFP